MDHFSLDLLPRPTLRLIHIRAEVCIVHIIGIVSLGMFEDRLMNDLMFLQQHQILAKLGILNCFTVSCLRTSSDHVRNPGVKADPKLLEV
jgi:hypothetical protein